MFIAIFLVITVFLLMACGPDESAPDLQEAEASTSKQVAQLPWPDASQSIAADTSMSCEEPAQPSEPSCDTLERQILTTVVRYEIYGPSTDGNGRQAEGLGHGTVKDGRYLVVHNHFGVDLISFKSNSQEGVVTMYTGIGDLFLWKAHAPIFTVVEESEILVLDFGTSRSGEGFFDSMGIQSARFDSWQEASPSTGQIVAQVTWDGRRSDVAWSAIDEVILKGTTPRIVLSNTLLPGASGGGVFLDGVHVGVNWQRGRHRGETGNVLQQFSTAALNTQVIADVIE
jgi:hypothetical protein